MMINLLLTKKKKHVYYGSITFSVKFLNEKIIKLKYSDKKMTDTQTHTYTHKKARNYIP